MSGPAKSLYRITYYDQAGNIAHAHVLGANSAAASAFLGASQTLSVQEIAANVQVDGVDEPHVRIEPKAPTVMPPHLHVAELSQEQIRQAREMLAERQR